MEEREPIDSGYVKFVCIVGTTILSFGNCFHQSRTYIHPTMYEARWMQREDYNQILVTPRMLKDHTPDSVCRVLRGLSTQYESSLSAVETHEA